MNQTVLKRMTRESVRSNCIRQNETEYNGIRWIQMNQTVLNRMKVNQTLSDRIQPNPFNQTELGRKYNRIR